MLRAPLQALAGIALLLILVCGMFVSLPLLLSMKLEHDRAIALKNLHEQFPVTVDPTRKLILENPTVNEYLTGAGSPLQASVGNVGEQAWGLIEQLAAAITAFPLYQALAASNGRFVAVTAGMRKEQVAGAFSTALQWTKAEQQEFLASTTASVRATSLSEGMFSPGIYLVQSDTTPEAARALVDERFTEEILSHYGPKTAEAVPLDQAMTIASLIQREAGGPTDMRIISGIIWNRLFTNMRLQIDATVQYAQANKNAGGSWWPVPHTSDLSLKSPYNTYLHAGLPPGPIANPSVAAVVAALNPVATDCLFYFHDRLGEFHCSATYKDHVTLLKKYFGRGK